MFALFVCRILFHFSFYICNIQSICTSCCGTYLHLHLSCLVCCPTKGLKRIFQIGTKVKKIHKQKVNNLMTTTAADNILPEESKEGQPETPPNYSADDSPESSGSNEANFEEKKTPPDHHHQEHRGHRINNNNNSSLAGEMSTSSAGQSVDAWRQSCSMVEMSPLDPSSCKMALPSFTAFSQKRLVAASSRHAVPANGSASSMLMPEPQSRVSTLDPLTPPSGCKLLLPTFQQTHSAS